ncbi:MAG: hypothetical protein AAF092_17485 [Pseudomonadota bacterium]
MKLLILGSGPSAIAARDWPRAPFDHILAINNAWQIRDDWDDLIYPYDFPADRMPTAIAPNQRVIEDDAFVPAQNAFGGFLYAGATMAFTATYWALHALKPDVIAYLGCDMVYAPTGATHFYGKGSPDPLRADISLRNLEAKSARAQGFAARQGCRLLNLGTGESRLTFPRATPQTLDAGVAIDGAAMDAALKRERALGYDTPTGFHDHIDADLDALDAIDALWLKAAGATSHGAAPTQKAA